MVLPGARLNYRNEMGYVETETNNGAKESKLIHKDHTRVSTN